MQNQNAPLFTGCATALITPFLPNNSIDAVSFRQLISRQIHSGIDALIILGTTGEPCTLSMAEREQIITIAMDAAKDQVPIIVGTGSNDTSKSIEYAQQAKQLGAQGQLCVTPYYNKTTQTGLLRHYGSILDHCDLPMILYTVPVRTGMHIAADTAVALIRHYDIAGIKDASGDPAYAMTLMEKTNGRIPVYCGNDDLILPWMAMGAQGVISVCANLIPTQTKALTDACLSGLIEQARSAQTALMPLIRALFTQVNPIPVKAALAMMGLIHDQLRLPLTPLEEPHRSQLRACLRQMQLIS